MIKKPSNLINFIAIGPGKSGTSWIFELFDEHPEICVSSAKETLFFEEYYYKGTQWYHRFFNHHSREKAIGEVSNTYVFSALAAQRIHDYNPDMKLISTLRNPVDRTFSHYLFLLRNGEQGSFEKVIKQHPDLVERGLYFKHLSAYLKHFSKEQLLCLLFDDLKKDARTYSRKLFNFLELDDLGESEVFDKKVLPASQARNRILAKAAKSSAELVRKMGFPDIITKVKNSSISNMLYKPYSKDDLPTMSEESRGYLKQYFTEDITKLSDLLDQDLVKLWLGQTKFVETKQDQALL